LGVTIVLLAIQLVWASSSRAESKKSVIELTKGRLFGLFVVGSLSIGLLIPLVVSVFSYLSGDPIVSAITGAMILIGSVLHKYTVLAAGIYVEMVPDSWPASLFSNPGFTLNSDVYAEPESPESGMVD
jgi:formate-dependent nitrite reductase membrane component NrfD